MQNQNGTMMQYFHWYYPNNGRLWNQVKDEAKSLSEKGLTALWLPPAYKGQAGIWDVGYGVYDMYDLGEFEQKGTIRTKYGYKDQYLEAVNKCHENGIQVYADVVLNHRGGADDCEWIEALKVDWNNRNREVEDYRWIRAYTNFFFPGRNNKYSSYTWNGICFDGVDYDADRSEVACFKLKGRGSNWEWEVSNEHGNYDYLMFADLDLKNPGVVEETKRWVEWYLDFTKVDGFRLDAIKHIRYSFFRDWLDHARWYTSKNVFTVGEYWTYDVEALHGYIQKTAGKMSLFDAPLHNNFHQASKSGGYYDMRRILDNTLMKDQPTHAVTLVENHDTQPLQALESPVDWWFKPLAYAVILLREQGYPCVFYPDYYGASYRDKGKDGNEYDINLVPVKHLDKLLYARKEFAYGYQHDYLDHWDVIGWTRQGIPERPGSGLAVLMSDGSAGNKWMYIGTEHAGKKFRDYLGNVYQQVEINEDGWGNFLCNGGSVSVWINGTHV